MVDKYYRGIPRRGAQLRAFLATLTASEKEYLFFLLGQEFKL